MVEVQDDNAEWHINPAVWIRFSQAAKENIISGLSKCRGLINGSARIVIKDGYSGETLVEMDTSAPDIYK